MYGNKRLYDMGGDIISNFYPSGTSESSLLLGDGKRKKRAQASKKATMYNKRNICRQGMKCYKPNSR